MVHLDREESKIAISFAGVNVSLLA
jgi:hypothetical protein